MKNFDLECEMQTLAERVFAKILLILSGMCVGAADLVPGISGGTVAFIIGIYERLLQSIASVNLQTLFQLRFRAFFTNIHWHFLAPFLLGVSCSFVLLAKTITYLLQHETYRTFLYATFMGLVTGSAVFCSRLLQGFNLRSFCYLFVGVALSFFLTKTSSVTSNKTTYDVQLQEAYIPQKDCCNVQSGKLIGVSSSDLQAMLSKKYISKTDTIYEHATQKALFVHQAQHAHTSLFFDLWLVICGALAVSAMLLPGISGSYLLQILGVYGLVLSALVDFTQGLKVLYFDQTAFQTLASMGLGIVLGAIGFSRVVQMLFQNHRNDTIAAIIGFMIGALHAVWPFRTNAYYLDPLHISQGPILRPDALVMPALASQEMIYACFFFALASTLILFIEYVKTRLEKVVQ